MVGSLNLDSPTVRSYDGKSLKEKVFKGQFTITRGEPYNPRFEKESSDEFKETAKVYEEKLNKLLNTSQFGKSFRKSEVIALERFKEASDDLTVHFNLHFAPNIRPEINAADAYVILATEFLKSKSSSLFPKISVDQTSLDITERRDDNSWAHHPFLHTLKSASGLKSPSSYQYFYRNPWEPRTRFPGLLEGLPTEPTPPLRRCNKIEIPFCAGTLSYNLTSYPNLVGHWNQTSVEEALVSYRQMVDAECYPMARELVCRLLQPECIRDEMVWVCRDVCEDFKKSCEKLIDEKILKMIKCKEFPRFDGDEVSTKATSSNIYSESSTSASTTSSSDSKSSSKQSNESQVKEKRRCSSLKAPVSNSFEQPPAHNEDHRHDHHDDHHHHHDYHHHHHPPQNQQTTPSPNVYTYSS